MNLLQLKHILETFQYDPQVLPDFKLTWSIPPDLNMGLLTTNAAFILAKQLKQNPNQLAQTLVEKLQTFAEANNLPIEIKTVGPYLNVDIKVDYLKELATTKEIFAEKINETVLIDYFNCNVAKKIHIGHIRSADIGESLRRILSLKYKKVITAPYLGDWGIQFSYLIWGLEHFESLDLQFSKPNLDTEPKLELINKFYQIYVRVNQLLGEQENIVTESKTIQSSFETYVKNGEREEDDKIVNGLSLKRVAEYWRQIIQISLEEYHVAEHYLNLNKGLVNGIDLFKNSTITQLKQTNLCWNVNQTHKEGQFDLFIGESFYIPYTTVFNHLVEANIATKDPETEAIYVDLEDQKLGRCYLISSEGYSLYHSRDIIARFVWAGLLEADTMLSLADNRQDHSFKQVFAILKIILESGIYENIPFGLLSLEETNRAVATLKVKMAEFIGFGFMTLPDGAMSTRKGKIVAFEELRETLEIKSREVLEAKSSQRVDDDLVRKVSVASLKWVDLYRDRDQDVVFDVNQFVKFEGNTGVYQLYTVARINSILSKNSTTETNTSLNSPISKRGDSKSDEIFVSHLNQDELLLLKTMAQLPLVLEEISQNYKPHLLCTHLFELATQINSWYAKPENSISAENDLQKKHAKLQLCEFLKAHVFLGLELLGIEPVEAL